MGNRDRALDPVEDALVAALRAASDAGAWDVVRELAGHLMQLRAARGTTSQDTQATGTSRVYDLHAPHRLR